MIAVDFNKQQAPDAGRKRIQQISFTGNIGVNPTMLFIIRKKIFLFFHFSQGTVRLL